MTQQKALTRAFVWFVAVFLSFCIGIGVHPTQAQVATGTISGYVKDPTGAAIPGSKVSAKMLEQQVTRTTETNAEGFYNLLAMPPGTYELTVESTGFQRSVRTGLELTVNQNLRVDVDLIVGAVETEVTVTAAAPLVDTTSHTMSGLIDDRRVVDLPLNGRNVIGLAVLMPGILEVSAPQDLSSTRGGPQMAVNGGRRNMNLFSFNGGYFNSPSRNTGMNYPAPDALQEVRILTHNFNAEYGHNPGSVVNVVSKTGSNEFHGSAWEFLRNDNLNARNFFVPRVPAQAQNQFGAAAGGPVVKNNLFFFATYQGLRTRGEAPTVEAFVPSTAERSGDFSHLAAGALMNPTDAITGAPFTDPTTGAPCVAGNIISSGCISPVAQSLLQFVPTSPTGTVVSLAPSPRDANNGMGRLDWNQSEKHRIYGHVFYDRNEQISPFAGGNIPGYIDETRTSENLQVTVNDTYTFSPTLLNEFTFMVSDQPYDQLQNRTLDPTELGINMPQYVPTGAVSANVSGRINLRSGFTTQFTSTNFQVKDSVNLIRGRHNYKFGYEGLRLQFRQRFIGSPRITFNGSRTGDPMADFMLGAYDQVNVDFGIRETDARTWFHSWYFQDQFKVTPRFTLTYGVRYEPFLPWKDKNDRISAIKVGAQSTVTPDAPPGILFPGDVPRGLADADLNNFAPRFGFAWDVFGNGKTSVRGGYGLFYESINGDSLAQENPPFAGSSTVRDGRIENPWGSVGATPPPAVTTGQFGCVKVAEFPGYDCPLFPLPLNGVFTGTELVAPYIQSFNLAIQHQLTPTLMVETAYAGKIGIKIEALRTYNPAAFVPSAKDGSPPSNQNINERVIFEPGILGPNGFLLGNDFRSWYHSFQVQLNKRLSRGLSLQGAYTLSKSIDTSSTTNLGATVANPFNLRDERGRSNSDRRHAFVASWLYTPPIQFDSRLAKTLLGGWTLTGITTIQSGEALTFTQGDDVALDGTFGDQHAQLKPNVTVEDIILDHSSRGAMVSRFFNTDAFVPVNDVPRGTYGNAGRGLISGPAFSNTDFAVLKDFTFREPYRVQFRGEFFNIFNQVNFTRVTTSVASSSFGRITRAASPRIIQFGLKFIW